MENISDSFVCDGLILAAGLSTRMGYPKALVRLREGGLTFLESIGSSFREGGIMRILVVVGHEREKVSSHALSLGFEVIYNECYINGQFSSVLTGLGALFGKESLCSKNSSGVLLTPVDHPFVKAATVREILRHAFSFSEETRRNLILRPLFRGRTGHPVFLGSCIAQAVLGWPRESSLRDFIKAVEAGVEGRKVIDIPVEDTGVLLDIDTEKELEEAQKTEEKQF